MELQEERLDVFGEDRLEGRGIRCRFPIPQGHFVCEYAGDLLIDEAEVDRRRSLNNGGSGNTVTTGSYIFELGHMNKKDFWVDATRETREFGMGRLINHSCKRDNIFPRKIIVNKEPRLCFFAARDLSTNEELFYDYGDKSEAGIAECPWLLT